MGKTQSKERQRVLRNNDPLAHVYLLQEYPNDPTIEHRVKTEFITDMGERLESQPFLQSYPFTIYKEDIVYDTGLRYMSSLRQSYVAAQKDVAAGTFTDYHAARQEAFLLQGELILEWANDATNNDHMVVFSLCPAEDELDYRAAKKQSFKPDRMMASVQLHAKKGGEGETVAFSLDELTLERLQLLIRKLGINAPVAETTIEQLTLPITITGQSSPSDTVATLIAAYDTICQEQTGHAHKQGIYIEKNIVEANSFVAAHPETYELYKTIVSEVAKSYNGRITNELALVVNKQLAAQYSSSNKPEYLVLRAGDYLSERFAEELVEYLRKQAIPEYLTQKIQQKNAQAITYDFVNDIGSAGAVAAYAGRQYDGACPSSAINNNAMQTVATQAEQLGLRQVVLYETPKPVLSKGDFDVLPIGSCPVCGAECGTGIRNKKSGRWYCTQSDCSAFKEEVYNYVFGVQSDADVVRQKTTKENSQQPEIVSRTVSTRKDISDELKQNQNTIWLLQNAIYDEMTSEVERAQLITELVQTYQEQQALIRIYLGGLSLAA